MNEFGRFLGPTLIPRSFRIKVIPQEKLGFSKNSFYEDNIDLDFGGQHASKIDANSTKIAKRSNLKRHQNSDRFLLRFSLRFGNQVGAMGLSTQGCSPFSFAGKRAESLQALAQTCADAS